MINPKMIEIQTAHNTYVQRLAVGFSNDFLPYQEKISELVQARLMREVGKNLTSLRRQRLIEDINEITNRELKAYTKQLQVDHKDFGGYEAKWQAQALQAMSTAETTAISATVVNKAAKETLIKLGNGQYTSYNQMLTNFTRRETEQLNNIVANGFTSGTSTSQIANEVLKEFNNKLMGSRKAAKSIARTGTNHFANVARKTYFDQEEVVIGVRRIATLDSVTSGYCRSIDNTVVLKTSGKYASAQSPFHINCRTATIPEVAAKYQTEESGKRPENFRDAETGYLMPGQTSSKKIFYEEFAKLDAATQDQQLGVTLGRAFRKGVRTGKFTPEDFAKLTINDIEKRPLTLKEMERRDNALGETLRNL